MTLLVGHWTGQIAILLLLELRVVTARSVLHMTYQLESPGTIAVYDIARALDSGNGPGAAPPYVFSPTCCSLIGIDIFPTHYMTVHQSAIRALAWIRAPPSSPSGAPRTDQDPTVIASGGYDGVECLTDIREGNGCVMNRTRGKPLD